MDETPPPSIYSLPSRLAAVPFCGDAAKPEHRKVLVEQNDQASPGMNVLHTQALMGKDYISNSNSEISLECAVLVD